MTPWKKKLAFKNKIEKGKEVASSSKEFEDLFVSEDARKYFSKLGSKAFIFERDFEIKEIRITHEYVHQIDTLK